MRTLCAKPDPEAGKQRLQGGVTDGQVLRGPEVAGGHESVVTAAYVSEPPRTVPGVASSPAKLRHSAWRAVPQARTKFYHPWRQPGLHLVLKHLES